jgi:DNA polymerase epsilon subunit 1
MASIRSRTRFVKAPKRGGGRGGGEFGSGSRGYRTKTVTSGTLLSTEGTSVEEKFERTRLGNAIDEAMGFPRYESGPRKVGWLINMQSTVVEQEGTAGKAGIDYYFLDGLGDSFKATVVYDPYFLIATKPGAEGEVEEWLRRKFEGLVKKTSRVLKEDLSMVATTLLQLRLRGCWRLTADSRTIS